MSEPAGQNSEAVRAAAAGAATVDPVTADLLARHAAGEKLTQPEYGKIGAMAAGLKRFFGKSDSPSGPAPRSNGDSPAVAPLAPGQALDTGLAGPPPDPDLCRRTTAAILKSCNGIAVRYVGREARRAGADDKQTSRFESAASLPVAQLDLMVDVSPDVLASLGLDPRNYPLIAFFGALGLWGTNIWLVVDDLKAMQKDREKERAERLHEQNKTVKVISVEEEQRAFGAGKI